MKQFNVLIVDDEELARESIKALLSDEQGWKVVGEAENGDEALAAINKLSPDVVFLDVEMPVMDGITLLQQRRPNAFPVIILTTAYSDFALDAFDLDVTDYLLKPFTNRRFMDALTRAENKILQHQKSGLVANNNPSLTDDAHTRRLVVRSAGRIQIVDLNDIKYIRASGNYAEIFTDERKYLHHETISRLEALLDPKTFIRIHRSTVVRIDQISELITKPNREFDVHVKDGTVLRCSRTFSDRIQELID